MKTLILNLPFTQQIIRRYKCSYNAPTFLLPPIELLSIASILKQINEDVYFIDAIAERLGPDEVLRKIREISPNFIVSILGIESINSDLRMIKILKDNFKGINFIVFNYLATLFPYEILKSFPVDFILKGEPELTIKNLYLRLQDNKDFSDLRGLGYKKGGEIKVNDVAERIKNLDVLPFPDRGIVNNNLYGEPFTPKPFTVLYTARGCPFQCIYCVPTYGHQVYFRSSESVVEELGEIEKRFEIKGVRIMDDTFTIKKERVLKICEGIRKKQLKLRWSCLSRPDTIDDEILRELKKAGCIRIYLGIESGSQRMLDYYRRGYKVEKVEEAVNLIRKNKIEIAGFFIVGGPEEKEEDFKETLELTKKIKCNYLIADTLRPYPGTVLFKLLKDRIEFTPIPYLNLYKKKTCEEEAIKREKRFYRTIYLNISYVIRTIKNFIKYPKELLNTVVKLVFYLTIRKETEHKKFI